MHSHARALVLVVLASACGRVPASVEPPAEAAPSPALAPIELDATTHADADSLSLPLYGALSFQTSQSDSCSQSWANTHRHGRLSLAAEADGRAVLRLDWDVSESGGSWQGGGSYSRRGHDGCTLDGRVRIESEQLLLEFEFPEADTSAGVWPPYECRPNFAGDELETSFEMRCSMTAIDLALAPNSEPAQQLSVLACQFGPQLPSLLADLLDHETRTLELADERLHVAAGRDEFGSDTRDRWLALERD